MTYMCSDLMYFVRAWNMRARDVFCWLVGEWN